jgi:hypothetical protein
MLIEVNSYRRASFLQKINYNRAGRAISFLQSMPPSEELIFFLGAKGKKFTADPGYRKTLDGITAVWETSILAFSFRIFRRIFCGISCHLSYYSHTTRNYEK